MPSCVCVNARVIKLTNTASFNDFAAGFDEHLPKLDRLKGHGREMGRGIGRLVAGNESHILCLPLLCVAVAF